MQLARTDVEENDQPNGSESGASSTWVRTSAIFTDQLHWSARRVSLVNLVFAGGWIAAAIVPAVLWVVVLAKPSVDERWENHPAHFWLVLAAALASVGLGYAVLTAARRRRDARLLLI